MLALREDGGVVWSSDGAPLARPVSCCLGFVYILLTSGKTFTKHLRNAEYTGSRRIGSCPSKASAPQRAGKKRGRQEDSSDDDEGDVGGNDGDEGPRTPKKAKRGTKGSRTDGRPALGDEARGRL